MPRIDNVGVVLGEYDGRRIEIESNLASVRIITGLNAVKKADRDIWTDGNLNYTVSLENKAGSPCRLTKFIDEIDTSLSRFIEGSVRVNGVAVPYEYADGVLSIDLDIIQSGTSVVIEFSVSRV